MRQNNGYPVSDPVNESGCQQVDQQLNAEVKGNQHGNPAQRNLIGFLECEKKQRYKIIHNRLHNVTGKAGIHRALVLIFHRSLIVFYCGLIRSASSSMIFGTSIFCGQCPVQAPHPIQSDGFPWDSILDASFSAHGPSTL